MTQVVEGKLINGVATIIEWKNQSRGVLTPCSHPHNSPILLVYLLSGVALPEPTGKGSAPLDSTLNNVLMYLSRASGRLWSFNSCTATLLCHLL